RSLEAQERGAAALAQAVDGLGQTMRVLMIGAHPDDEDTQLIAWLARGRRVETAYLSLTRGDGGQNLIGNELGEALGAIRTEELLAARRIDGGQQFFTRAYDFGFSKTAEETYRHWPKDSVLGDVVRVVRLFRPHVIVAVFSGTPRDGHGHHQVSGQLAREAYDVAGDTVRFPHATYGVPWTPLKFYRSSRSNAQGSTLGADVGQYDPVLGRSFSEIAAESRSQHKSQGFGQLERKGPAMTYVRREASRVDAPADPNAERSIFAGIDTTWGRFADVVTDRAARMALDSIPAAEAAVRAAFDVRHPERLVTPLAHLRRLLGAVCPEYETLQTSACARIVPPTAPGQPGTRWTTHPDLERTLDVEITRVAHAVQLAAGVEIEAEAPRELLAANGAPMRVVVRFHNRGADTVATGGVAVLDGRPHEPGVTATRILAPGTMWIDTVTVAPDSLTQPWWLVRPRMGDLFAIPPRAAETSLRPGAAAVRVGYQVEGHTPGVIFAATTPVVYRYADPVLGDVSRPLAVAPVISVVADRSAALVPANAPVTRTLRVQLRSADTARRTATVRLQLPRGLAADSAARQVTLDGYGATATVAFTVRGRLAPGTDTIHVVAESGGERFAQGYQLVDYPHIRPQRLYRPSDIVLTAVDVAIPPGMTIAYVPGVGDNVAPVLQELGLPVTVIEPAALATTDLSSYSTVVVGPRAYQAYPEVMAQRGKLLDVARRGGTLVVQYQQTDAADEGVAPYGMTFARPADRVTIEEAPVTVLDSTARVLNAPNDIGPQDFAGWVQERSLYMPRTFDAHYAAPLEMHDPGEPPNRGALLVTPLGKGTYVYTTLSLFRQLPAGVPGAVRLFVNLLAAGQNGAAVVQ
ncbi:MAG TPA: PIG-L family deacetylase, partial [Gemmatimonadaceae bacterium]|nr:PIG-L family deacetylase [Gemmatimonadaceae bacterium]